MGLIMWSDIWLQMVLKEYFYDNVLFNVHYSRSSLLRAGDQAHDSKNVYIGINIFEN